MNLKRKSACGVVQEAQPHVTLRKSESGCFIRPCSPAHTMSLLTPSESRAFQSFLDATVYPVDWSMQLEISHEHMPPAHGTEALTKATKDLMALDGDNWRFPPGPYSTGESTPTSAHRQQQMQSNPLTLLCHQRCLDHNADEAEQVNLSSSHLGSSNSHSQLAQLPFYHAIHSTKRSPPPDAKLSNKRHRPSSASLNHSDEAQLLPQNRTALLSPSQKKANHIQSEQKRRANIRRGYDALCETVPALREACEAEEEQQFAEGKHRSRRRGKGKAKSDDGERIDGRAGPRSENVVLSKSQ